MILCTTTAPLPMVSRCRPWHCGKQSRLSSPQFPSRSRTRRPSRSCWWTRICGASRRTGCCRCVRGLHQPAGIMPHMSAAQSCHAAAAVQLVAAVLDSRAVACTIDVTAAGCDSTTNTLALTDALTLAVGETVIQQDGTPLYTFIRCFNRDKQGVSVK